MNPNQDLFSDQGPEFAPVPDRLSVVAGKVVATLNKPSAMQKRFNTLMASIDAEQGLMNRMRQCLDTHGLTHRQAVDKLMRESQGLYANMITFLDSRIQASAKSKGLTATQKQQAIRMLLTLADTLESVDDPALQAIVDRYAPSDDEDDKVSADVQEMLASYLGEDFAQGRSFESTEAVLKAAMEHMQQREEQAREKRDAKRAARKAAKTPSAKALAAQQSAQDAQSALRTVYRQLASALHPDREPDVAVRAKKTALMSEVNAAYERKELSVLLRIQLQSEIVDATKAAALTDERLKALCAMLAEQQEALQQDNQQLRMQMEFELGYRAHGRFDESELADAMEDELADLQEGIFHMRADLERVQDDRELKRWLKQQLAGQKAMARAVSFMPDDLMASVFRR